MVSRVLGVDLGAKRIGLAVADLGVGIARPLATVNRGATLEADAESIGRVCREQAVTELVVGLPVEARGNETLMLECTAELLALIDGEASAPRA